MYVTFGPTLQQLYDLQKALQRNDTQQIALLREQTKIEDDYETLTATMRFMQIGMAIDYLHAKKLQCDYVFLKRDLEETKAAIKAQQDARAQRADLLRHMDMEDRRRQEAEYQRAAAKRQRAEEKARQAKEENDIWSD